MITYRSSTQRSSNPSTPQSTPQKQARAYPRTLKLGELGGDIVALRDLRDGVRRVRRGGSSSSRFFFRGQRPAAARPTATPTHPIAGDPALPYTPQR